MNRQCIDCGGVLPEERFSVRCSPCWIKHEAARNRAKVRAHRERARAGARALPPTSGGRLPTDEDLAWLSRVDQGLADLVRQSVLLLRAGRTPTDPEVARFAIAAVQRYDSLGMDFVERGKGLPGADDAIGEWDGFFDSVRKALR